MRMRAEESHLSAQSSKRKVIVAIDGPSGAGKSTIARHLSRHFGLLNLETGAMYRAFALKGLRTGLSLDESAGLEALAAQTTIFSPLMRGAVENLHRFGLSDLGAQAVIARTMVGQAYLLAADDIFWISGWICILLIGLVWLCRKAKSGGGPAPAAD